MNPDVPGPDPSVPPGPEPVDPTSGPTPTPGLTPTPAPSPASSPGSGDAWGGWLSGGSSSHDARRAERRARRDARRAERGMGGSFWGVLLVIAGAGILAAELVPGFDWELAWPVILIAFGVLLVAASIRRPQAAT